MFALYNYEENGINWWKRMWWIRPRVGYSYGVRPYYYEIPISRQRHYKVNMIGQIRGNTGELGKWAFRLDDPNARRVNHVNQCYQWYYNYQQRYSFWYQIFLPACPCRNWQAFWDPRFSFNWRTQCAVSRISIPGWGWWWYWWYWIYTGRWSRPPPVW